MRLSTESTSSPARSVQQGKECNLTPIRPIPGLKRDASPRSPVAANNSTVPELSKSELAWWNRTQDDVFTYGSTTEVDTTAGSSRDDDWSSGYGMPFSGGKCSDTDNGQQSITNFLSKNSVYKKKIVKRVKKMKAKKMKLTTKSASRTTTCTRTEDSSVMSFDSKKWL